MLKNYNLNNNLNEEDEYFLQNLQLIKLKIESGETIPDKNVNVMLDKWYWSVQVVYGDEYQFTRDHYLADAEFYFNVYHQMVVLLATKGVSEAQYKLYLYNSKIEQPTLAFNWLMQAAENNHLPSIYELIRLYCEGNQEVKPNTQKALELSEKFLKLIQNQTLKAISEKDVKKATFLIKLNEEVIAYLKNLNLPLDKYFDNSNGIEFLCDDKIMQITVQSLNQFINNYKMHIDVASSKWQLANYFADDQLIINKDIKSSVRPMGVITFKFASKQASLSENYLYWYLIKMGITCRQLISSNDLSRICIFSIDDVNIIKSIPAQCKRYIDKIIDDYHPSQLMPKDDFLKKEPGYEINIIRPFLIKLKNLVDDVKWNDKAYTLFSYRTPEHFQNLRTELKYFHDKLSDTITFNIFANVKKEINSIQPKKTRDPEVNDCYSQLKNEINNLFVSSSQQFDQINSLK